MKIFEKERKMVRKKKEEEGVRGVRID